jgi:hypothetical protein
VFNALSGLLGGRYDIRRKPLQGISTMKAVPRLIAVFLALAWLTGCSTDNVKSSDVKTRAIYQTYAITHHAETAATHAHARFRVGQTGTNVILTDNSSVTCDRLPLQEGNFFGTCYGQSLKAFQGEHVFVFTDSSGKTFRNAVSLERADFDAGTPAKLSRGTSHTLAFAGPPLRAGETVVLNVLQMPEPAAAKQPAEADPVADPKKKADKFSASGQTSLVGATGVELTALELQSLRDGPATLQWTRAFQGGLAEATPAGGAISGTYVSTRRPVVLEK